MDRNTIMSMMTTAPTLTTRQIALTYRTLCQMPGIQAEAAVRAYSAETLDRLAGMAAFEAEFGDRKARRLAGYVGRLVAAARA